ncbi:MAG: endonuclease/exonuclease/phosphatase family protein [Candidatus Paceibacterota bacterium]|jgi:endonuclease/exonuclease/phosphatase family metal-dependent hydrolase|nr:endonuclease/exonuclease/phosphatase family protein [Candidatus Paceibacterota bacterium]
MKNNSIHLVSLNIEHDKHYDAVIPFLKEQDPDVVCLQEVFEKDVPRFEKELGMRGFFSTFFLWPGEAGGNTLIPLGVAILTKLPIIGTLSQYYANDPSNLHEKSTGMDDNEARALLSVVVDVSGTRYTIGTTHFTWTPKGSVDDRQRRDLKNFFEKTDAFKDGIVFSGDFNAPRGREIFDEIARRFKDNIPPDYATSLDPTLHRAPEDVKYLMVDGLFSTPEYSVSNVSLRFGVSDHAAIVADIKKNR